MGDLDPPALVQFVEHKLEIEGATNPWLYGRAHFRRLMKLIRSVVT